MTSTRETRREEYSSNVVRHLQPSRPLSPYSQKSEFDNNLDYILDDLQQSVSRPGSSLGQPITNYSSSRHDVHHLNPVNSTTVLRERSLSPNLSSNKIYKTSKYEYSTSSSGNNGFHTSGNSGYHSGGKSDYHTSGSTGFHNERVNHSEINKLDTLLNDLEHERTATLDRNRRTASNNNIGIDLGLLEPGTKVIKTTTTYSSKNPVSRELVFESPDTTSINRSIRHQSPSSYETRTIESSSKRNVSYTDDGLYGKPRRTISPIPVNNNSQQRYVTETKTTRTISPTPVTNTERYITDTRTVNHDVIPHPKNVNYNEVVRVENSTGPNALRDIQLSDDILPKPKTKVTTTVRTYTYEIPEPENSYPDRDPPKNTAMFYKTERNERSANYYQAQSPPVNPNHFTPLSIQESPPHNTVYRHDITNITNVNNTSSGSPQVPPGGVTIHPPHSTTVYKETINTTNKQYRSPTPNNYPDNAYPGHNHPYGHQPHPGYPHQPNEPSVVVYKQTTTNTRNVVHPRPEREPLLHPFPVDGPVITELDGSPPKRVEDLMASFGDTSEIHYTNKRVQIAEKPLTPNQNLQTQTKVYSSETDDKSKAVVPSKNITGPPVYYPPNHELFLSKEESSAGYRNQGGYARGKGKYEYEASSKSKSSSKSGAAVVPLCCPLCCAVPCTIM